MDAFISQCVLKALEPAALTLSLAATTRLEQERQALDRLWQQRWERAAYASARAARHSRLVDPEHRLVARQLAQDWADTLTAQRQRQEDDQRFLQVQPRPLAQAECEAIAQLAQNIPALWHAPTTTMADRKELVRPIIQRVMVAGEGLSERLQITIEGAGGGTTAGITTRPISRIEHLSYDPLLGERLRNLAQEGYSTVQITACLAHEGCHAAKQARPFSRQSVMELMRRLGVYQSRGRRRPPLTEHAWWLSDFERELGRSNSTLHQWRQRGWLQVRWHEQSKRWVAGADAAEVQRLKQPCARPAGYESRKMWLDAQPSQPTVVHRVTTASYPQRRCGMQHDHNPKCLDDRMVVDTSNAPSPGSAISAVCSSAGT
jgi:hypothetical protein